MFAVSRRMTACDFLLLGSSVALLVVSLWPTQSDRQSLEIRTDDGHFQRYSVSVNDPRLEVIKVRLKRWRTPSVWRAVYLSVSKPVSSSVSQFSLHGADL